MYRSLSFTCLLLFATVLSAPGQLFKNLQQFSSRIKVGDPQVESRTGREGPKSLCLDDLDADGRPDFIAGNLDGTITVAFGNGGLSFEPPIHLRTGALTLRQVICGDYNGDGLPDIVAAAPEEGKIHVIWNLGSRNFASSETLEAWPIVRNLAAGDFNGDGDLDLAAAGRTHGVAVYHGDGQGGFGEPVTNDTFVPAGWNARYRPVYSLKSLSNPNDISRRDNLVLTMAQGVQAWVTQEHLFGQLSPVQTIALPHEPHELEVAVITSKIGANIAPNLITADKSQGLVIVRAGDQAAWNNGQIRFGEVVQSIQIPGAPRDTSVVDLNNDGWNDLVVVLRNFNRTISYENVEGRLEPVTEMPVGVSPREIATGNLNDDEYPDFVVANRESQDVSVALGSDLDVGFESLDQVYPVAGEVTGLELVDMNGDGRDDIVQVHRSSGDVSVRLADEAGRLTRPRFYHMGILPSAVDLRDLNGDGKLDVMTANLGRRGYSSGSVSVRLAQPNGTFGPLNRIPTEDGANIFAVEAADFDKDGLLDYAVGYFDCRVAFYRGESGGRFELTRVDRFTYESRVMVTGDWNQDGNIDVAGAGYAGDVVVLVSDGNLLEKTGERYDYPPISQSKFGTREITTSDVNKDGDPDLLVGSGKGVMLLLGSEGGTFEPQPKPLKGTDFPASSLTQGDMDGDGLDDLAVSCRILSCVTILKGDENGEFNPALTVDVPAGEFIRSGDVDGDGQTDLVGSGSMLWVALSSRKPEAGPPYTGAPKRPPLPQVVINEILASNNRYRFLPSASETADAVELFNGSDKVMNLNNWKLRRIDEEDGDEPDIREYTFSGDNLAPGQRLTLYCSTRGYTHLHTGFKLPASGTTLELLDGEGNMVDRVTYPELEQNVSFCRYQDGVEAFRHNLFPDIGRENVDNGELEPTVFFRGVDFDGFQPNQPVRVTARANDDVGVIALSLVYKPLNDPVATPSRIVLYDDGQHDDGGMLDGFFAGRFPGLPQGTEIQFYVEATDLNNKTTYLPSDPILAVNRDQLSMVYTLGFGESSNEVRFSEIVTDNETMYFPEDTPEGNPPTPDYAIIKNTGDTVMNLEGLIITQDFFGTQDGSGNDLRFLPGTTIAPGGEMTIFFADRILRPNDATFPLRKNGETLYLVNEGPLGSRTLIDRVETGKLAGDEAYVRGIDGRWSKQTATHFLADVIPPGISYFPTHQRPLVVNFFTRSGRRVTLESSETMAPGSWESVSSIARPKSQGFWRNLRQEHVPLPMEMANRYFRVVHETMEE